MRNLKRALSLTLASVMLLGMMVVGSSAASYPDVDEDNNVEAIEVLQAVGVMVGDAETGNFRPNDNVKRSEMARIMADLMDLNYEYYTGTNPFTDMEGHWAEKYVAACYTNGIIAGRTETTYDPEATVTAVEAAAMLMRALGYFQNKNTDYEGGFVVATVRQAGKIDLFNDVTTKTNDPMTRDDVAQLVLNTLESGMVEPDSSNKIDVVLPGGGQVSVGATNYVYVTSREDYALAINQDEYTVAGGATATTNLSGPIVDLGEKLYQGNLTKDESYDVFGRPANIWEYQGKEIGTYTEDEDQFWSTSVTAKKLYDFVGKTATDSYKWTVSVDGATVYAGAKDAGWPALNTYKSDDDKCFVGICTDQGGQTGNGVLTQVYVDGAHKTVDVSVIHYYAAEVYSVKDGVINLAAIEGKAKLTNDYATTDKYEVDDVVVYSYADGEIREVYPTSRVEGYVESVSTDTTSGVEADRQGSSFVVEGETYRYNKTVSAGIRLQTENVGNDMVGYLDPYGYCVYVDESAVTYDYAYVLSIGNDRDMYDAAFQLGSTVYARLLLADGTIVRVQTDIKTATANGVDYDNDKDVDIYDAMAMFRHHIVSYSKDSKNVYSLAVRDVTKAGAMQGTVGENGIKEGLVNVVGVSNNNITKNNVASVSAGTQAASTYKDDKGNTITINGTFIANSNTVFVVAQKDNNSYEDYSITVYNGIKNVPEINVKMGKDADGKDISETYIAVAANKNGVARMVYIQDADITGTKTTSFIEANKNASFTKVNNDTTYYTLKAVVDGEATTLRIKGSSSAYTQLISSFDTTKAMMAYDSVSKTFSETKGVVAVENITYNSDGMVTNVRLYESAAVNAKGNGYVTGTGTSREESDIVVLGSSGYGWDNDKVYLVRYDYKKAFSVDKMTTVQNNTSDQYLGVVDGRVLSGLCIQEVRNYDGKVPGADEDVIGESVSGAIKAADLNKLLEKGNVIVTSNFTADDNVIVPNGRTLVFQKNATFNDTKKLDLRGNAKVTCNETLAVQQDLPAGTTVKAKNMTISGGSNEFGGIVTVTGALTVSGTTTVSGTMTVGNEADKDKVAVSGSGKIIVTSTSSLHITGNVHADTTIQAGTGTASENGFVEIKGEMKGTFDDQNVTASAPTQKIESLDGAKKVTMSADAKLSTEVFKPTTAELKVGATITLENGIVTTGTDTTTYLEIKDEAGNKVDDTTTATTIVIGGGSSSNETGAGANKTVTVSTSQPDVVVDTTPANDSTVTEAVAPFKVSATVVYDQKTWDAAVTAGYKPVRPLAASGKAPVWADFIATDGNTAHGSITDEEKTYYNGKHGVTTFPWLLAKVDMTDDVATGTEIKAVVTKDGSTLNEYTETTDATWVKDATKTLHWDMANNRHDADSDSPVLNQTSKALDGTYTVTINWTVNGKVPDSQKALTATATYTAPALISVQSFGGQKFTVDQKAGKITIDQVISLAEAKENNLNLSQFSGYTTNDTLESIKGTNDYAAIVFEVNNPDKVFTALKHTGPTVQTPVDDTFNETTGKTTFTLFVNADSKTDGTGVYKVELISGTQGSVTYEYTVEYTANALEQLRTIKAAYDAAQA